MPRHGPAAFNLKPAAFEYFRPSSLAEALSLLEDLGDEARPLAGGQSLVPMMNFRLARPTALVDLARVPELRGIAVREERLEIQAMVTESEIETLAQVPEAIRMALPLIGHFQIRNRGTVGGSLAHCDPAAEWPALALAFDAELHLSSRQGNRVLSAAEFIKGPMTTALRNGELLVKVTVPVDAVKQAFTEVARRPGDFALVGAVHVEHAAGHHRVVVFGAGSVPQRMRSVEERLLEVPRPSESEVKLCVADELESESDTHASAQYRRHVGASLVWEVVARTWR